MKRERKLMHSASQESLEEVTGDDQHVEVPFEEEAYQNLVPSSHQD